MDDIHAMISDDEWNFGDTDAVREAVRRPAIDED